MGLRGVDIRPARTIGSLVSTCDLAVTVLSRAKGDFPQDDVHFVALYAGAGSEISAPLYGRLSGITTAPGASLTVFEGRLVLLIAGGGAPIDRQRARHAPGVTNGRTFWIKKAGPSLGPAHRPEPGFLADDGRHSHGRLAVGPTWTKTLAQGPPPRPAPETGLAAEARRATTVQLGTSTPP